MKIPKRFKLYGKTINVVYDATLLLEHGFQGAANYRRNRIELLPNTDVTPISAEDEQQTFCHELMHYLVYYSAAAYSGSEKSEMHTDEGFIDQLGSLLHQALTTMEYEEEHN